MGVAVLTLAKIALLLLGLLFVIFGSIELETEVKTEDVSHLGVVIDAGGSGTRLIVYENKEDKFKQLLFIEECESRGLTKWKDSELTDLKTKLKSCFEEGAKNLPGGKKVPIFLAATAGMRLLELRDKNSYDKIWKLVSDVVGESEFSSSSVLGKITGFEEAKWAWVAANYLRDSSFDGTKYGTIDFGSSSLQIAFEQNFNTTSPASEDLQILNLNGKNISIYAHSYLCFGNDEIQRRFLAKLVKTSNYANVVNNPCFFSGFNKTYTSEYLWAAPCSSGNYSRDVLGEELTGPANTTFTLTGSGNFTQCYNLVDNLINRNCTHGSLCGLLGTYQPKVHGSFYALSTYYHISKYLGVSKDTGKAHYRQQADKYCSKSFEEVSQTTTPLKYVFPRCFQSAYSYFLLASGFKFDSSDWSVDYIKRVEGTKVGWPLGLIYSKKREMHKLVTYTVSQIRNDGYIAMLIVGVFCLLGAVGLFVVARTSSNSADGKV